MKVNGYTIGPRANLRWADLSGANLRWADLSGADLSGADFREANLRGANLRGADLSRANLRGANLRGADLSRANLSRANLSEADLRWADLSRANLSEAKLPHFQIVPEVGSFYAFKKTTKGVIKIQIPASAKRTSTLIGRKCRANKIKVIGGEGVGGKGPIHPSITYYKGETYSVHQYDDDIGVECTQGIHFFMTKREAEEF